MLSVKPVGLGIFSSSLKLRRADRRRRSRGALDRRCHLVARSVGRMTCGTVSGNRKSTNAFSRRLRLVIGEARPLIGLDEGVVCLRAATCHHQVDTRDGDFDGLRGGDSRLDQARDASRRSRRGSCRRCGDWRSCARKLLTPLSGTSSSVTERQPRSARSPHRAVSELSPPVAAERGGGSAPRISARSSPSVAHHSVRGAGSATATTL
jgi:hypothetical protein